MELEVDKSRDVKARKEKVKMLFMNTHKGMVLISSP
jgi:hypothetical protein